MLLSPSSPSSSSFCRLSKYKTLLWLPQVLHTATTSVPKPLCFCIFLSLSLSLSPFMSPQTNTRDYPALFPPRFPGCVLGARLAIFSFCPSVVTLLYVPVGLSGHGQTGLTPARHSRSGSTPLTSGKHVVCSWTAWCRLPRGPRRPGRPSAKHRHPTSSQGETLTSYHRIGQESQTHPYHPPFFSTA